MLAALARLRLHPLPGLAAPGGLSDYEIAPAMHLTKTRRASVIRWIKRFAILPKTQAEHAQQSCGSGHSWP